MVPEIGHFSLIIALLVATVQCVLPITGAALNKRAWIALARPAAQGQFVFVALAFACLTYAFITKDYSVKYAAMHSNSQLPIEYRIAGVWGGHEGSLLLWVLFLNVWTVAVTAFSRQLDEATVARVIGAMGFVAIGFHLFMLLTSNPFERLLPAAPDGQDLNPLLQDFGLVIHPPMLYMGYVGFSVAFAFAIAALLGGKLDAAWARWSRPWTLAAWCFLTCGIALGSWWAYYEMGWGGWWFWDPVENASFMPWLVGTALVHSLAVTDKRGTFRNWTVLLAIFAFSLSLLGTFLVRSGVLVSVHAFASDPKRGMFILAFLATVVIVSLLLYAWRAPKVGFGGDFKLFSRETMLLVGNVLLSVASAAVLLGTVYPLIYDALFQSKLSVGEPFFETVFVPLMAPVIFLMGVGPMARWKQASAPDLIKQLRWAAVAGVIAAIVLPLLLGRISFMISFGVLMAAWVLSAGVVNMVHRVQSMPGNDSVMAKLGKQPRHYFGMLLAHAGIGIFILGVTIVKGYQEEKDVRMDVGDVATMGAYQYRFEGTLPFTGPNYKADRGTIVVLKEGKPVVVLHPEKRTYNVQQQPMTEAAIESGFFRQLYVSLGEDVGNGAWSVRLYYKPMVAWIWGGCLLMALGGMLSISDRRYRLAAKHATAPVVAGGAVAGGGS